MAMLVWLTRAPTHHFSIIFTSNSHLNLSRSLKTHHLNSQLNPSKSLGVRKVLRIKSTNVAITKKKIGNCHVKNNNNNLTKIMIYVLIASSDLDVQ
jgi:hypothetical protein